MAENRAEDIRYYAFAPADALLVDANVWFYIYGPSKPDDWRASVYSKALADMLAARSQIYIDVLVLSEFINRYARLEHALLYPDPASRPEFKQFRQSADFKPVALAIAVAARHICQICARLESGFSSLDIAALVDEYAKGETDFNDQVLADLCRRSGLKLVTHDGDFKHCGLTLVTANRRLLDIGSASPQEEA